VPILGGRKANSFPGQSLQLPLLDVQHLWDIEIVMRPSQEVSCVSLNKPSRLTGWLYVVRQVAA